MAMQAGCARSLLCPLCPACSPCCPAALAAPAPARQPAHTMSDPLLQRHFISSIPKGAFMHEAKLPPPSMSVQYFANLGSGAHDMHEMEV